MQSNKNRAKIVEAKIRADAADALHGIGPAKLAPFFQRYIEDVFLPHIRLQHQSTPNTIRFYEYRCAALTGFEPFATARLSEIEPALILQYIGYRLASEKRSQGAGKVGLGTVNHELTTLRVALKYARDELRLISVVPKISRIKRANSGRMFVVSGELEKAYLAAAPYPLKQAATLICDLGLRPAELVQLSKADISDAMVSLRCSKTVAGIRTLPQTVRSKGIFEELFALWPSSPWVFPGLKPDSHYCAKTLDALHADLRDKMGWPAEFVLYSFRHTFGSRLAESGASPYAIMKAMGHTRIETSMRYIHLGDDSVTLAMKQAELYGNALRGEVVTESKTEVKKAPPIG